MMALITADGNRPLDAGATSRPDVRCLRPGLVDPVFRDRALATLEHLIVEAPGRAGHGAVRMHLSPGYVDPQGRAWHQISTYQANLAMIGALGITPRLLGASASWLRWQANHTEHSGNMSGVVPDQWMEALTLELSSCPPGKPPATCGLVDAVDSSAATMLLMADAYLRRGGDPRVLQEHAVRKALHAAAFAMESLTTDAGLTIATPTHRIAYLMDAVEVVAGWRAWSRVQRNAFGDAHGSDRSSLAASRVESSIRSRLWDDRQGLWRAHLGGPSPQLARWYPDAVAQMWPLLWGVDTRLNGTRAWLTMSAWWDGKKHWADRNVDPAGFWWPAAAVAAACVGDSASARRWVRRARSAWVEAAVPFPWPFQVGDLLWLFSLAHPSNT